MKEKQAIIGTVYQYRYIDHGAQYRVYEVLTADGSETRRVIKVPLSFGESKRALGAHLSGVPENEVDHTIHTLMVRKQQTPGLLQGMYATDRRLMYSLGNLKLVPMLPEPPKGSPDYFMPLYFTQDYVLPMSRFLHTFRFMRVRSHSVTFDDTRRAKQLLRALIQLHYQLWEYGIFDMTFKIENVGVVLKDNAVAGAILVDAAEHTYDLAEAETTLRERKWWYCLDPAKTDHLFLPVILHEEFMGALDAALTVEALHRRWQKKSKAVERHAAWKLAVRQALTRDSQKSLMLWLERQSLRGDLHHGIPSERIDSTHIPYADLMILLEDTRVGKMPPDKFALQEEAERTMYANDGNNKVVSDIYRHMLQQQRIS
jgi:hypothetical protein